MTVSCLVLGTTHGMYWSRQTSKQTNKKKKKEKTHFVHKTYDMHLQA